MVVKKPLVLIVDDEKYTRLLIKKWMERNGYDVITAVNGSDCLKKLTKDINLILLDIMMPGLTPKEIINGIKKKNSKASVIYLTSVKTFDLSPEQEKMEWKPVLEPPVIGLIEKPVEEYTLIKKIEEALKVKKFFKKKGNRLNKD